MIKAVVIVRDKDSDKWHKHGRHEFSVLPRVDEHIELRVADEPHLYRVVAVCHPEAPTSTAACDIYAAQVGRTADVMTGLAKIP